MFHLFNEAGIKPERLFSLDAYNETIDWATKQIENIEDYSILDWLRCKEKPDYFCWNLCSARRECPNGVQPNFKSKKKKDDYFEEED